MARRNTVYLLVTLSLDPAMCIAQAKREVRSRINEGCCHSYEQAAVKVRGSEHMGGSHPVSFTQTDGEA